ncbi:UNVERIFIED_CONTAM: hypothetical protein GTU68_036247 [Idotea baltica]|nr:hypothetical protein [Idotea baltica]
MDELGLGPNGGLVYCMEYLAANLDWFDAEIAKLPKDSYLLIDCPGQIELYTHQSSMRTIVQHLTSSSRDHRLCAVHLVDSHHCSDPGKFISILMTALTGMLSLALPHVNVLSKADLIDKNGKLPFNTEFFTEVLDLSYLLDELNDDAYFKKYRKFNQALVGLVEDHSLVSFVLLTIQVRYFSAISVQTNLSTACVY